MGPVQRHLPGAITDRLTGGVTRVVVVLVVAAVIVTVAVGSGRSGRSSRPRMVPA